MDCLFCKIATKEMKTEYLAYEDTDTVAFLDIFPRSAGHMLVVPKVHAENIIDLSPEQIQPLFLTVKKITAILDQVIKPRGFTIGINHGKQAGQAVDHLHVHIIPRYEGDGGGSIHSIVNNPPKEHLDEIFGKIKSVL